MTGNFLLFLLEKRVFGVRLSGAIEILPWRPSRPVPLSYSYVEGLMDYRGKIYPVFNLAQRLGLSRPGPIGFTAEAPAPSEAGKSIILLEENTAPFGISVDSVFKMAKFEDPIGPLPEKTQGVDPKFVKGLVFDGELEVMILNFERLLHAG